MKTQPAKSWRQAKKRLSNACVCFFDEHRNESQAGCGSDEMLTELSTESCTVQGENKALTSAFWCSAQHRFLIGSGTFSVRRESAPQHATLVRCTLSFPQRDASGNSLARGVTEVRR